jgi:HEAT repeat protein
MTGGPARERLVRDVLNDPAARAAAAGNPLAQQRRQLYAESARGVLTDLAAAGCPVVDEVGELRGHGDYRPAVPVLLHWLPRAGYLLLATDIARTLAVPFARAQAFAPLVTLFREPPPLHDPLRPSGAGFTDDFRVAVANALSVFAGPATADALIELSADRTLGEGRALLVAALPRTKDPRVPEVLLSLLDDEPVVASAVEALGKLKVRSALGPLEALADSPDRTIREQVKKALTKIRKASD